MMDQNYVADGSFKKRILVGIKLSSSSWFGTYERSSTYRDLKCGPDHYENSQLCVLLFDG